MDATVRKKPNIVLITMDECKASAVGCYGNEHNLTPHLDRFSTEGMLFEQSYCTFPKCVPSRAAMLTGRYPHTDGHRTLPGFEIREGENNLAYTLKSLGYATGLYGKNHTIERDYLSACFDDYVEQSRGLDVPWSKRPWETDDDLFRAFYRGDFSNLEEMADTIATKNAIDFIERRREEPFFLLLNYNAPHPPYTDISPYIERVRELDIALPIIEELNTAPALLRAYREVYDLEGLTQQQWRKVVEAYYGLLAYVDEQIGQMLAALEKMGLSEDTLVIITSDHGDFAGEHGCVEKWDTMFYDCLIRVPLLVRWPGHVEKAYRSEAMIENVDLAPTIMSLCGFEVPNWMHGISFEPVLLGKSFEHKQAVYCEGGVEMHALERAVPLHSEEHLRRHPNYYWKQKLIIEHPWTLYRAKMIRTKEWKLIYRLNGMKELYNLIHDPHECMDVSMFSENSEVITYLMEKLLNWTIRTETDYPYIEKMYS